MFQLSCFKLQTVVLNSDPYFVAVILDNGYSFGVERWSFSMCPRGNRVGGQLNVHVCPLGVGG